MSSATDPGHDRGAMPRLQPASLPYGVYNRRQFFDPNTPPIDPPTPAPDPKPTDPPGDPADLGDKGKAAIEKERSDRQAAEARAKAAEKELTQLKGERQREADKQAEEQGKFKELAETRLTELTTVTQDRDGLKSKVESLEAEVKEYRDAAEADYQTALKALPEALRDLAPDGELAARREWLAKAQKSAEKVDKRSVRGNPPTPRATGPAEDRDDPDDDAARKRQIAQTKL